MGVKSAAMTQIFTHSKGSQIFIVHWQHHPLQLYIAKISKYFSNHENFKRKKTEIKNLWRPVSLHRFSKFPWSSQETGEESEHFQIDCFDISLFSKRFFLSYSLSYCFRIFVYCQTLLPISKNFRSTSNIFLKRTPHMLQFLQ